MTKEREEGSTVAEAEGKLTMVAEQAESWGDFGPWVRMFRSARRWVG